MKVTNLLMTLAIAFFAVAFTTVATQEYKVDTKQSKVNWIGRKVTGEHSGAISIKEGKLIFTGNRITGGSFTIDMNTMTNDDIQDETYSQKLVGHLKSDDFFSTEKYPNSTFVITKVNAAGKDQYKIKGDLTIKGITKEVEFPATVKAEESKVKATAKIVVDRTLYDIKYGSGSFFDNLGDKAIDNNFELNVELVASK